MKTKGRMFKVIVNGLFWATLWGWSREDVQDFLSGKLNTEKGRRRALCIPPRGNVEVRELY